MQFTYSSCAPSLGLEISIRPNCREYNDEVAAFLAQDHEITTVFLVAAYVAHPGHAEAFSEGMRRAVALLLGVGKRVVEHSARAGALCRRRGRALQLHHRRSGLPEEERLRVPAA
jgi:hypothetical protein